VVRTRFVNLADDPAAGSTGYFALNLPDAGKAAEIRSLVANAVMFSTSQT